MSAKKKPRIKQFCSNCGGGTTWGGGTRAEFQLCPECNTVRRIGGGRFTCMDCDKRNVLDSTEPYCKPCRIEKLPAPRCNFEVSRKHNSAHSFDGSPGYEIAARKAEG